MGRVLTFEANDQPNRHSVDPFRHQKTESENFSSFLHADSNNQ